MARRLVALMLVIGLLPVAVSAANEPVMLSGGLSIPVGLAMDADGDLWVASDNLTSALLTELDPDGRVLQQIPYGTIASIGAGTALALDPGTGLIWVMGSAGDIQLLDPATGTLTPALDLRALPVETDDIYELASGSVGSAGGTVLPETAFYGDLALLRRGETLDVLVTGVSVVIPFVLRITIEGTEIVSARVVIASLATTAPVNNLARGIAVNDRGTVVTALPDLGARGAGNTDRLIAFELDDDVSAETPPRVLLDGANFTTTGMTAGADGTFYAAVGTTGPGLCTTFPAVVTIDAALGRASCTAFPGGTVSQPEDVSVSPDGEAAYVSATSENAVWAVPLR
jgi:DNA-binding beta-propeller fold protein YncE